MSAPLTLIGLHHVARVTAHLDASIAFYRDVLGFREIPRPSFTFRGAWLFNYGFQIHLIEGEAAGTVHGPIDTRDNHIAFAAADLDSIEAGLRQHGIEYRVNFQANNPQVKQIFFRDPDGHHVEVGAYGESRFG